MASSSLLTTSFGSNRYPSAAACLWPGPSIHRRKPATAFRFVPAAICLGTTNHMNDAIGYARAPQESTIVTLKSSPISAERPAATTMLSRLAATNSPLRLIGRLFHNPSPSGVQLSHGAIQKDRKSTRLNSSHLG